MRLSRLIATWLVLSLGWISSCAAVGAPAAYDEFAGLAYTKKLSAPGDVSGPPA